MRALARHTALLAFAALLTWWVCLRPPVTAVQAPPKMERGIAVAVQPRLAAAPSEGVQAALEPVAPQLPEATPTPEAANVDQARTESIPTPAAPELGTPDGESEEPTPAAPEADPADSEPVDEEAKSEQEHSTTEASQDPPRRSAEDLMRDRDLLRTADMEVSGKGRKGFATVLLAAPEDQLDIARFFGEEVVLVPRDTLDVDAKNPRYFRISGGKEERVERVDGPAPLQQFRQYRDLFDYEYARLPEPLRALRRSVLARNEIYLFAALIPQGEWAVVIGRRREALALTGRSIDEVARFVLRYHRRPSGGFDLVAEQIDFADGSLHSIR